MVAAHGVADRLVFATGDVTYRHCLKTVPRHRLQPALHPPWTTYRALDRDVRDYETAPLRFSGGADGLDAYRAIFADLPTYLRPGGTALFEIGFDMAARLKALAARHIPGARVAVLFQTWPGLIGCCKSPRLHRAAGGKGWSSPLSPRVKDIPARNSSYAHYQRTRDLHRAGRHRSRCCKGGDQFTRSLRTRLRHVYAATVDGRNRRGRVLAPLPHRQGSRRHRGRLADGLRQFLLAQRAGAEQRVGGCGCGVMGHQRQVRQHAPLPTLRRQVPRLRRSLRACCGRRRARPGRVCARIHGSRVSLRALSIGGAGPGNVRRPQ